jgi:hypothetical protein
MRAGRAAASDQTWNWKGTKRMKTKKCPVCDWEIKDSGKEVKLSSGAVLVVCCDDCAVQAKAAPEKFTSRK